MVMQYQLKAYILYINDVGISRHMTALMPCLFKRNCVTSVIIQPEMRLGVRLLISFADSKISISL